MKKKLPTGKDLDDDALLKEMRKVLRRYLTTTGKSKQEAHILKRIARDLRKNTDLKEKVVYDDDRIGVFVVVPSLKKTKRTVLFDAHVDTCMDMDDHGLMHVNVKHGIDIFQRLVDLGNGEKNARWFIKCACLDNRLHVAVLLMMAKYCRYDHTSFVCFFSANEEDGMTGALKFATKVDLENDYGCINVCRVIVLDTTKGMLPYEEYEEGSEEVKEEFPLVGGGIVPVRQNFAKYGYMHCCNAVSFRDRRGYYRDVEMCRINCCCTNMHDLDSVASLSDMDELFLFFLKEFETWLVKQLEMSEQKRK